MKVKVFSSDPDELEGKLRAWLSTIRDLRIFSVMQSESWSQVSGRKVTLTLLYNGVEVV